MNISKSDLQECIQVCKSLLEKHNIEVPLMFECEDEFVLNKLMETLARHNVSHEDFKAAFKPHVGAEFPIFKGI